MQGDEAREVLGFPPNSRPTPLQVKAAYKRRAWETHPDRFPAHDKFHAESKFKLISEAYSCLRTGSVQGGSTSATRTRVVRTGAPRVHGARSSNALVKAPFLFLILGTITLGGLNAARAYQRQKETYPSHNPFLP
ncbi:uncharacterized protein LOC122089103 isoform X1 [Macadamia integrifolia]|uniref:uncharacterized protein LOC122089103 isoform X1 n=1 Tax=Macadamia integrifolia TaxID=60698 RepID=UPI001C4FD0D8|nr:uncharacterized protein LOC122089103 isoform X1 [Macadamia integrifolia]